MNFDGSHSKSSTVAGVRLVSPKDKIFNFAFRLEFDTTNNVAEYEALLLGLDIAKDMQIKNLKIIGDSDLIISPVKGTFACKNERLKRYRNAVWGSLEFLESSTLEVVPRDQNRQADALAVSASTLILCEELA